jgi:hypothetical protein
MATFGTAVVPGSASLPFRRSRGGQVFFGLALTLVLLQNRASADIIVGSNPLPASDSTTYPDGVLPISVQLTAKSAGGDTDFTKNTIGLNYSYNGTTHALKVSNSFLATNTKHVTFDIQ